MDAPERLLNSVEIVGPLPFGLMSLADMVDYQIFGFAKFLQWITASEADAKNLRRNAEAEDAARRVGVTPPRPVSRTVNDQQAEQTKAWLKFALGHCETLELISSTHRIELFAQKLRYPMTVIDYEAELRALDEALNGDFGRTYFYHYPTREAKRLLDAEKDWSAVFAKFESCKVDALAAVDAWALKNGTGCVFHCMRVAEIGLRALARERKVRLKNDRPLEYAQWQDIIKATEAEAEKIANWVSSRAQARERALTFYRGVLGELHAFKEVRNGVMHSRTSYDQPQAESVLNHVQGFMGRLAERLDEKTNASIKWGR